MTKKFHRLVVDDDQNMSKTLQDILWSHGYQTAIANTGAEALALAKKNNLHACFPISGCPA